MRKKSHEGTLAPKSWWGPLEGDGAALMSKQPSEKEKRGGERRAMASEGEGEGEGEEAPPPFF